MTRRRLAGPWENIEDLIDNPALHDLAAELAASRGANGGRPRKYPEWVYLLCLALLSEFKTADRVEAFLRDRWTWRRFRKLIKKRFPNNRSKRARSSPPSRDVVMYWRDKLAETGEVERYLDRLFEVTSIQAVDAGYFASQGVNEIALADCLISDGKSIATRLGVSRRPGKPNVEESAELLAQAQRYDPGVTWQKSGAGERSIGHKFQVLTTCGADTGHYPRSGRSPTHSWHSERR